MGRPKEHDEATANALLDAAERTIRAGGIQALSVRGVADDVGTTTRAVYSLFGSKDGLLAALGARAHDLLASSLEAFRETDDPSADLVDAALEIFRPLVLERPMLFRIAFSRTDIKIDGFDEARSNSLQQLKAKIARIHPDVDAVTVQFDALCEGLADIELRGGFGAQDGERVWRDALATLIRGWSAA